MDNASEQVKQEQTPAATAPPAAAHIPNPLSGRVSEKSYSQTNQPVNPADLTVPIPESGFAPPPAAVKPEEHPFSEDMKQEQKKADTQPAGSTSAPKPKQPPQFSEQIRDLPPKEKHDAAEKLAETILRAYGKAHTIMNGFLKISDRKIFKLQTKKEIDLSIPIPYDSGEEIPLAVFIKEYNKQVADTLTVDPEWRAEVKPILTRVLAKYGHGMSDEQQLLYLVSEDVIAKGAIFAAMKRQTSDVLEFAKAQTAEKNKPTQSQTTAAAPAQPQAQPQPQQPQPNPQPMQQTAQQAAQPASQPMQQQTASAKEHVQVHTPLEIQNEFTGSNHPVDNSPRAQEASRLADTVHEQTQKSHLGAAEQVTHHEENITHPLPLPIDNPLAGEIHIPGNVKEMFKKQSDPIIEQQEAIPESTGNPEDEFPEEIITGRAPRPKKTKKAPAKKAVKKQEKNKK